LSFIINHYCPPTFFFGPLLKKFAHHWSKATERRERERQRERERRKIDDLESKKSPHGNENEKEWLELIHGSGVSSET